MAGDVLQDWEGSLQFMRPMMPRSLMVVLLFARDPRFLLAGFGLFGLCGLYRGLCDLLRISGILRS